MAYTVLVYSVFMMRIDAKVTPTDNTDYSCHIKSYTVYSTNHMGSISHHIMPLVIDNLGGGHTHTQAYTHTDIFRQYVHMYVCMVCSYT